MPGPEITIDVMGIRVDYAAKTALAGVEFQVRQGEFLGVIGPNGAGKSSLLRCLSRAMKPQAGAVYLAGRDLQMLPQREVAREVAVAGAEESADQAVASSGGFTVREIIAMGRYPHRRRWRPASVADEEAVTEAIRLTGVESFQDRLFQNLSSGERQRVVIARALAQGTGILLLDEPTAHLDLTAQVEIFNLLRLLNLRRNLTIITVLHDLNLAAQFCDSLILLDRGRIMSMGEPVQVLQAGTLEQVYRLPVSVAPDLTTGRPRVYWRVVSSRRDQMQGMGKRVHVVGGGGTGTPILEALAGEGYVLSIGVLNQYDSDWHYAGALGLETVVESPFAPVSPEKEQEHLTMMRGAAVIVVAPLPLGRGNLANLRGALTAAREGKPVILCDFTPVEERDFTGGEGARLWRELGEQAKVAHRPGEVLTLIRTAESEKQ